MFEKPHEMAGVLELVDVGPNLGLPCLFVGSGLAAGGATGVQADGGKFRDERAGQLDEDAADLLDLLFFIEQMFVTQQVTESQLASFGFRLRTRMKRAILRP